MPDQRAIGTERILRLIGRQNLCDMSALSDVAFADTPSILERREHLAAEAFVNGRRWYANRQLEFQGFANRRLACRILMQTSRRLIEESRQAILKTKNTLAFSRKPRKLLN